MSGDILNQPLRGVAIYNPSRLLSKQELIDQFVVRTSLLDSLLDDFRRVQTGEPAQHYLLVGQRGMGKTTFLRRLRYAIEDEPTLDSVWLPLDFPEEQYNVARLSDLYVNWLDALGDALQARGRTEDADRLDAIVDGLPDDEHERAAQALQVLKDESRRLKRRFVLLIDNMDLVLGRLSDEHWKIRTVLSAESWLTVIGASAQAIEATYEYDQAFYDFFQIHDLRGLILQDMRRLLERLAELHGEPRVVRQLDEDPGRLPTLHVLTGGNPRTVIILYEVLATGGAGSVRTDLDRLLDQHTPLYKARFESMAAQAQQIVDALAIHWHPATAADLATIVRLPVNAVSAQLDRLVNQGVVEKVPYHAPESRTAFQIAERFFNIWYLMRASRRVRRKLIWLVEFLRLYHSPSGLRDRAECHLHAEAAYRRAVELAPENGENWNSLAWFLYCRDGDLLEADAAARKAVELAPKSLQAAHTLATILARRGNWDEAIVPARRFLAEGSDDFHSEIWNDTLRFFREAVKTGRADDAMRLLDELGLSERWLPLREALAAAAAGTPKYLRRVAPEVRRPAEEILARLQDATPAESVPPVKEVRAKRRRVHAQVPPEPQQDARRGATPNTKRTRR